MQVSVETTEGLGRRMRVQVPAERIEQAVESRLNDMRPRLRLHGFRPGKVPMKVVRQRYGEQVRGEVLSEVVESSYAEAVQQENLQPAGAPSIEDLQATSGEDLSYTATFEVMPQVEVRGVENITVERPQVEITDADVDEVLERLRRQHATFEAVERPAQEGDRVLIDFHGTVDGEEFNGNRGEDTPVEIGSGRMPVEFEQGLVGISAGEQRTVEYTFPQHFPDEAIAGRKAVFDVTAKSVEAPRLPEADDDFARHLGIEEGGLETLRGRIRESLERDRDQAVRRRLKEQVMEGLYRNNPVELPRTLVDGEVQQLRQQARGGQPEGEDPGPSAQFEEQARRRVTLGLVVNEIVRSNDIKLDQERLQRSLAEIAAGYERPREVIQHYTQDRRLMEGLQIAVLEDQVVDWAMERVQTVDKPMSLEELMTGGSAKTSDESSEEQQ